MSVTTLANRYASALFALTKGENAATEAAANALLEAAKAPQMKAFLRNPTLKRSQQAKVLQSLVSEPALQGLLGRVALNRRLDALPEILKRYIALCEEARGEVRVSVDSATAFNEQEAAQLAQGLGKALGKAVHVTVNTVPDLLGGLRVKLGNSLIDYSAAAKLERLKSTLKNSPLGA